MSPKQEVFRTDGAGQPLEPETVEEAIAILAECGKHLDGACCGFGTALSRVAPKAVELVRAALARRKA